MPRIPTLLVVCLISLSAACHCALAPVPASAAPAPPRSALNATFDARAAGAPESGTSLAAGNGRAAASQTSKPLLRVERLGQTAGFLTATFTAANMFSPRIVETLSRGLPATLEYEIQLWKKRGVWFDKLAAVNRLTYRVVYDPWEDGFRVVTKDGSSQAVFDIEHIEQSLCFRVTGRIADMAFLEPLATYYVVIRATLRPLSAEDVDDVETWLSDGTPNKGGGIRAIPGYLFDVIVGLSGLGDQAVSGRSGFFGVQGGKVVLGNGK